MTGVSAGARGVGRQQLGGGGWGAVAPTPDFFRVSQRPLNVMDVVIRSHGPDGSFLSRLQVIGAGNPSVRNFKHPVCLEDTAKWMLPPSFSKRFHGLANVDDSGIGNHEVQTGHRRQHVTVLPVNPGERFHLRKRRDVHHGRRHSETARRSRYAICPLRLRSSSFAHSVSTACKSGVSRRMKRTAASAMTKVCTTSILLVRRYALEVYYQCTTLVPKNLFIWEVQPVDEVAQAYRDAAFCDLDADWRGEPEPHDSDMPPGVIPVHSNLSEELK